MCVLSEVCSIKTVGVEAGTSYVPALVTENDGACGGSALAIHNAIPRVLSRLTLITPYIYFSDISLSLDSSTREES